MQERTEKIINLILEISRIVRKKMILECGDGITISPIQIHALSFIERSGEITMKEFAKHLKISSPSATAFANRLVNNNWVKRLNDPNNRRLVKLKITDYGKDILENKRKERIEITKKIINIIPKNDQTELIRILSNILENYKKQGQVL